MECPKCGAEIGDGQATCSQCHPSLKSEKTSPKKYWLATLSAYCILAVVALQIISIAVSAFDIDIDKAIGVFAFTLGLALLVAAPVLGITALLKIYQSNDQLGGKGRATAAIFVSSLILAIMAPANAIIAMPSNRMFCATNLKALGTSLAIYLSNNSGQLADPENWCDLLITEADADPALFICRDSDAIIGESSYALNKAVVGMNIPNLGSGMVVMFETTTGITESGRDFSVSSRAFNRIFDNKSRKSKKVYKDRWNQVAGPQSLAINHHEGKGCNILFADGHVEFVSPEEITNLRWSPEGKVDFPLPKQQEYKRLQNKLTFKKMIISVTGVIIIAGACIILYRYQFWKCWGFAVLLGLSSAVFGWFLGGLGQSLHRVKIFQEFGMIAGAVLGFIVGLCYVAVLTKTSYSIKQPEAFKGYAVSLGMATGAICSTIVHLLLMIINEEKIPLAMIVGLPFGIIAGAILGWISSAVIKNKTQGVENG
jgi:prepilin-type processing-associated H-X9-DG protein